MLMIGSADNALSKASGLLQEPCEAVFYVVLTDSANQSCKGARMRNHEVPMAATFDCMSGGPPTCSWDPPSAKKLAVVLTLSLPSTFWKSACICFSSAA